MALIATAVGVAAGQVAQQAVTKIGGSLLSSLSNAQANGVKVRSLADLARTARVEPLALIDRQLRDQPFMEDLMKFSLTTFTAYYLQAVNLIMNVNKAETLKVFDSLNPERSQGDYLDLVWSSECYEGGLPLLSAFEQKRELRLVASVEDAAGTGTSSASSSIKSDKVEKLYEVENLAVGKLVNIELKDGDDTVKLPVIIRLIPAAVPSQGLVHIFTLGGKDGWGARLRLARAGQIRYVRDLILGMDIVDAHRRTLVNDTSGTYQAMTDRRRNNSAKAAASGKPSMADASNIAVISKDTAKEIGRAMYGRLDNYAVRQKIFDNSYLIVLMVVDEDRERVTVYHRGLDLATDYSLKEIKGMEKNKGPDITELFKTMFAGMGAN